MRLLNKHEKKYYEKKMLKCVEQEPIISVHGNEVECHIEADKILCKILSKMGYRKIVRLFNDVDKWYE